MVLDDAGVVNTAVIDNSPMSIAKLLEDPPAENSTAPGDSPLPPPQPPARRPKWSLPTAEQARQHTDELGRIALRLGALFVKFACGVAGVCAGIADFVRQVVNVVPPALRLLGALGLCLILSIAGSVALDNALGKSCAAVFVPGFALAFGVVANRWYRGLGGGGLGDDDGRRCGSGVENAGRAGSDVERSVEYVDAKLAFALAAFGTERHQQAVVALIQAKAVTELSCGTDRPEPVGHGPRPRISDGGAPKTSSHEEHS